MSAKDPDSNIAAGVKERAGSCLLRHIKEYTKNSIIPIAAPIGLKMNANVMTVYELKMNPITVGTSIQTPNQRIRRM